MLSPATVSTRWQHTLEYLRFLDRPPTESWHQLSASVEERTASLAVTMLLLHPRWLVNDGIRPAVQGDRTFPGARFGARGRCEATVIWGYDCPRGDAVRVSADHIFPYWAGGPTIGENRLSLCTVHNAMKAGDLHLYPWEVGEPPWFRDALRRMEPYVRPPGLLPHTR